MVLCRQQQRAWSKVQSLEVYHGRAINLHEGDGRLPFHSAFLFREMRVRGYWPLRADRPIPLPIAWVDWIGDGRVGRGRGDGSGRRLRSRGLVPGSSASGKVFIPMNPFTDPTALQTLKESFAE